VLQGQHSEGFDLRCHLLAVWASSTTFVERKAVGFKN
jgi:hypothetical protein